MSRIHSRAHFILFLITFVIGLGIQGEFTANYGDVGYWVIVPSDLSITHVEQDEAAFGLAITPIMGATLALMVGYATARQLYYRILSACSRAVIITPSSDVYYYLGFMLTISAIAIGMSTSPESSGQVADMEAYIHRVIQASGSAIWSTIFGLILRLLFSNEHDETPIDPPPGGEGGEEPPTPPRGPFWGRFLKRLGTLIGEHVTERILRELLKHRSTQYDASTEAEVAAPDEPAKGSQRNPKKDNAPEDSIAKQVKRLRDEG